MLYRIIIVIALAMQCCSEVTDKPKRKVQSDLLPRPLVAEAPCENEDVYATFIIGGAPGEENQYDLTVKGEYTGISVAYLKFDSDASVILKDPTIGRIYAEGDKFRIDFAKIGKEFDLQVAGPPFGTIPYIQNIILDSLEYCDTNLTGYFDYDLLGTKSSASVSLTTPDEGCGRRKVEHTGLILNGQPTKPGDWPWHVALYRLNRNSFAYICGGTLISNTVVLTAAHCVTIRRAKVVPKLINVVLGKYNLVGGDIAAEEREVNEIIVHKQYNHRVLDYDIAILKLKSEVIFNDYIQPACIWQESVTKYLVTDPLYGTVVGWGFDQTDTLSSQLQQEAMPIISEVKCIRSHPGFFTKRLNDYKFCAGYRNGTSACNGDSGGGFVVFVPDSTEASKGHKTGAWYVRGIVSTSVSRVDAAICDPSYYVLFTDVNKFKNWIKRKMK